MTDITVAAASPDIQFGDLDGNLARIVSAIGEAARRQPHLIVLPELATSGYMFVDRAEASSLSMTRDDERWGEVQAVIPEGTVVVVGYCERAGDAIFNTAAVLTRDARLADYRKAHLWGAEKQVFDAGDAAGHVVAVDWGRLGVAICYDNEFPEVPRALALDGADVLALPVNWPLVPRPVGEYAPEVIQAMAAARSSRIPTVIADRAGMERGVIWTGGTVIIDGSGWIAASGERGVINATVSLDAVRSKALPPHNDLFGDRRPELYRGH